MHDSIVPPLDRTLAALANILCKAEAHCTAKSIKPAALLTFRLYPDMFDFTRQVQLACDFAARAAARLSGSEVPSFPDTEATFGELLDRIARARDYLASIPAQAFADAATRQITITLRGQDTVMTGLAYQSQYSFPQVYFHTTTAFNILRHNGVEIGKRDYMGA